MKHTLMAQDAEALRYIKKGVDIIGEAVRRTLGPEAGSTLMYRTHNRGPRLVDDGYYTAEAIEPKNPYVKLVSEYFKEAVMRTNRIVGDGTSATAVVAWRLFNEIYNGLIEKMSGYGFKGGKVMTLRREILEEADKIKEQIRKASTEVKDLETL